MGKLKFGNSAKETIENIVDEHAAKEPILVPKHEVPSPSTGVIEVDSYDLVQQYYQEEKDQELDIDVGDLFYLVQGQEHMNDQLDELKLRMDMIEDVSTQILRVKPEVCKCECKPELVKEVEVQTKIKHFYEKNNDLEKVLRLNKLVLAAAAVIVAISIFV